MSSKTQKIVITNYQDFENIINELKESLERIKELFNSENNLMKKIDNTDIWSSNTQEKVYSKYLELSEGYNHVIKSLETYIRFLENTLNSYKEADISISKSVDNNIENLDVN